jgi:hypothetical protein
VVAGQDHDGLAKAIELGAHEPDRRVVDPVVVEEVTGDRQEIDALGQRAIDDAAEDAPLPVAMRGLLIGAAVRVAAEMDVGGVKNAERASQRSPSYTSRRLIPR